MQKCNRDEEKAKGRHKQGGKEYKRSICTKWREKSVNSLIWFEWRQSTTEIKVKDDNEACNKTLWDKGEERERERERERETETHKRQPLHDTMKLWKISKAHWVYGC